ncbi:MAG TPA: septum site-determining protein MinC, partial [Caldilineaceae bacterium]|nr:septum site-determining protein MinC [Caldilineaceae bacterium]
TETPKPAARPDEPPPVSEGESDGAAQEVILAPPYIYHGTLRSGQVFRHAGTVMIIGDVNPGAEVISGGDIFVWGRLRGIVHAGAMGNERALVCAIDFEPIQLRIAGYIAMSPKAVSNEPGRWFWKRDVVEKPEVARVMGKQIVVDVWDSQYQPTGI